ncbi:MAG: DUF3572 domain-containing protein [Rhodobacteraceae bacterium]|nr:DUF3572 domain-containing protein [Paracoccaceae bacterium]
MQQEFAEIIALKALAWLVGNEELLPVFLGATGADIDGLRAGAADPAILVSILDFVTMDDAWVTQFCDANDLKKSQPLEARQVFAGAQHVHWT